MAFAALRAAGKTWQAMAWVSHGERVRGYPGWSRVLVVPTIEQVQYLKDIGYWRRLEDFDHRVYSLREWAEARGVNSDTEVCIDNLDLLLPSGLPRLPGRIVAVTMTAHAWRQQTFREKAVADGVDL